MLEPLHSGHTQGPHTHTHTQGQMDETAGLEGLSCTSWDERRGKERGKEGWNERDRVRERRVIISK